TLLDYLASRLVTRQLSSPYTKKLAAVVEKLADHYVRLRARPAEFAARAANVLGQVPAYSINLGYNELVRTNRLARLLLQRASADLLDDPGSLRDLLGAPEGPAPTRALPARAP